MGRVVMNHRRLSVIDLTDRGRQPMTSADGRYTIVYNGEIYNYKELRAELESTGVRFVSASDTEVILSLFASGGAAMLPALRGMFAFVIWDAETRTMFAARDPFGIKPLYVTDDGKRVRFASEVKALARYTTVDTSLDPAGHVGFFLWGSIPEPHTLYRGIRAVPAGTYLSIDARGCSSIREYASVAKLIAEADRTPAAREDECGRSAIRDALFDTVSRHLVADVEVGVFLSAGIDSATVASLAAEAGGGLRTITLGFHEYRNTPNDETGAAAAVAARIGARHETIWTTRAEFESEREHLIDRMDQPSTDGVNTYLVARAAAQAGLKVVLSGLGGDELFGGYPGFRQVPRVARWLRGANLVPTLARTVRIASAPILSRITSPKYAGLFEYGGAIPSAYLLRRGLFMPWELNEFLDRDLVRAGLSGLATEEHLAATVAAIGAPRLQMSALEATWYMRNQLLRDTDWASMSHSVEVRVPLVDWVLWRTVSPLLAGARVGKAWLAEAASPALPPSITSREKTGFATPTREWGAGLEKGCATERGLRGWAKYVYARASA
jgi:asparagine synthase (glutamine-hydrolysing)